MLLTVQTSYIPAGKIRCYITGQLKSYLAACPNARWRMWVGSELHM